MDNVRDTFGCVIINGPKHIMLSLDTTRGTSIGPMESGNCWFSLTISIWAKITGARRTAAIRWTKAAAPTRSVTSATCWVCHFATVWRPSSCPTLSVSTTCRPGEETRVRAASPSGRNDTFGYKYSSWRDLLLCPPGIYRQSKQFRVHLRDPNPGSVDRMLWRKPWTRRSSRPRHDYSFPVLWSVSRKSSSSSELSAISR